MKNNQIYRKHSEHIANVLEIRLCFDTWKKVKKVSIARKCSYSWVVRYTLFRLIKRKDLNKYVISIQNTENLFRFERISGINDNTTGQLKQGALKHRHKLCLYGDDELYIRLCAARLGCTMTHLVRFCLHKYLDTLMNATIAHGKSNLGRFKDAAWYWLGIKIHYDVEFHSLETSKAYYNFNRFQKLEYW